MGGPGSGPRPKVKVADFEHPGAVRWGDWKPAEFESATFVAFVDIASLRFDRSGQLTITLTVPAEHVEAARDVRWAAHSSVPLAVRMEPWSPIWSRLKRTGESSQKCAHA
jgi:hypothetical protein